MAALERFQETLKRLLFPCTEQRNGICSKSIPRVKRPSPSFRTYAFFAVVERVTVVEDRYPPTLDAHHEMARISLIPRRHAHFVHRPSLEDDLSQYLAYLSRLELCRSVIADATYLG